MDATGITIPFDVENVYGKKRVPIVVEIKGEQYRTTIFRMGGEYRIPIPKEYRKRAGITPGERIVITIWPDAAERKIEIPKDLAAELKKRPEGIEKWNLLSFTSKKEHARALEDAKKPETRLRRLEKIVRSIAGD